MKATTILLSSILVILIYFAALGTIITVNNLEEKNKITTCGDLDKNLIIIPDCWNKSTPVILWNGTWVITNNVTKLINITRIGG